MKKNDLKLQQHLYEPDKLEQGHTRDGMGHGLVEAGERDERVMALCADLTESTRMEFFRERFPDRFIEIGIAEQNLATVGAGLAAVGKIPFITSYAAFNPGRNWEQIRTAIAYNNQHVVIVGAHAGVSVGPDGATHQAIEDIATMRVIANMTVLVPCDMHQAHKAAVAAARYGKPVYLRIAREKSPIITTQDTPFEIGKAQLLRDGSDLTIFVCGALTHHALMAAHELEQKNKISVSVVNVHTIKPLDEALVVEMARKTKRVVTLEEHQIIGGLGGAIAEVLGEQQPTRMLRLGMRDHFGESGEPNELIAHFGLDAEGIIKSIKPWLSKE